MGMISEMNRRRKGMGIKKAALKLLSILFEKIY